MRTLLSFLLLAMISPAIAQQAQQSPADIALARMRDAMKKQNERIAQADAATAMAQAAQFAAEAKLAEAEKKIAELVKNLKTETEKAKADRETGDKVVKDLEAKLKAKDEVIADASKKNAGWKVVFDQVKAAAEQRGGLLEEAQNRTIAAERKAQEHERKNREMYKLGTEVLERYKSFGLGTALLAREPFVGSMRVKFQNYVNDYGDKLATQRIGAAKSEAVEGKPKASNEQPKKP